MTVLARASAIYLPDRRDLNHSFPGPARGSLAAILHLEPELGDRITRGQTIAVIRDPFGKGRGRIAAPLDGIVIGHTQHPLVNRGDAVLHVSETETDA